jgi:hypothetical protein
VQPTCADHGGGNGAGVPAEPLYGVGLVVVHQDGASVGCFGVAAVGVAVDQYEPRGSIRQITALAGVVCPRPPSWKRLTAFSASSLKHRRPTGPSTTRDGSIVLLIGVVSYCCSTFCMRRSVITADSPVSIAVRSLCSRRRGRRGSGWRRPG